jgi:hypothetical protein
MRLISRSRFFAAAGVIAFAAIAHAADVAGKWTADVPGRGGQAQATTFDFKVSGETLTGTVTNQRGSTEITDGKVMGDELSFTQKLEFNGNSFVIKYTGKVDGATLKMKRMREGGDGAAQEFTAKRPAS